MIVVDTSAILAIIFRESDANRFIIAMLGQEKLVSAATLVECYSVVCGRKLDVGNKILKDFISGMNIETVPFNALQAEVAASAYQIFGKGSGHPAQLNLGDTFSYALAKTRNIPLLFKGDDFIHTDIMSAISEMT